MKKLVPPIPVVWDHLVEPNHWFMMDNSKMRLWSGARATVEKTIAQTINDWKFANGSSVEFVDDRTELERIVDEEVSRLK